ncbi:MAG: 3D domain-containing protein [Thermoleophilia bacterium]
MKKNCSGGETRSDSVLNKLVSEEVILSGFLKETGRLKPHFLPKLFVILTVIPLSLLVISSATATSAGQQSESDLEAKSSELDARYRQSLADLVAVDSEVNRTNTEIQTATQRRDDIQGQLQAEQQRLDEIQSRLTSQQGSLEKRLLSTYKSDDIGYLEVVLGAGDFSDFLNRVDMVSLIAEDDRELIISVQESRKSVEEKLALLSRQQEELAALVNQLSSAQQNLLNAQAEQQRVSDTIKGQMQDNENMLGQLQSEAAAIETSMNNIQNNSGGNSPPPAGGSSFTVTATAYCLGGTTATGMPVGRGIIAVDPRVIRLGSRVHVSGYGDAIAADTGGAIKGNKIDVWLPCGEAYAWGVRTVNVTVY